MIRSKISCLFKKKIRVSFSPGVRDVFVSSQALPRYPFLIRPGGAGIVPWEISRPTMETIGNYLLGQSIFGVAASSSVATCTSSLVVSPHRYCTDRLDHGLDLLDAQSWSALFKYNTKKDNMSGATGHLMWRCIHQVAMSTTRYLVKGASPCRRSLPTRCF